MGDGRDLGRNAAEDVSRRQMTESSSAAVDEVFSQWDNLQTTEQVTAFTEELAPYLPQMSAAFLNRNVEIDGVTTTYFDAIDTDGDGYLQAEELSNFSQSADGAAQLFANYLLEHYNEFDNSDGAYDAKLSPELMTNGFQNDDGTYTYLNELGLYETYFNDGTRLTTGGTTTANAVYTIAGPPEMSLTSQDGADHWTVTIAGQPPITYPVVGEIEHTYGGFIVTRPDGTSDLFQSGMVTNRDADGNTISKFGYDNNGLLVDYWHGDQHWWMDRRGLATMTNGTWYLEGNIADGERTVASKVYMDGAGNVVFEFQDGYSKTVRQDGDVSWDAPVVDPISGAAAPNMTASVTRDEAGQVIEVQAPPFTQPWTFNPGDAETNEYDYRPAVTVNDDGSQVPGFTLTFPGVEGGTRQYQYGSNGQLNAVVNPDGSRFELVNGQYLYYTSANDSEGELAMLTLTDNRITFTLGQPPTSTYEYLSNGQETLTVAQGTTEYVEVDGVRTSSETQNADGTNVRIEQTRVTVTNADGTATQYRLEGDHWVAVTGRTDEHGSFIPNNAADEGQNVRAGFNSAGNFIVFQDVDGNLATFDPGAEYRVISPTGVVSDINLSTYSGPIEFTDQNQVHNTMVFTNGAITSIDQTTPGGQHVVVQLENNHIVSIQLPDGSQIVPVMENGVERWQHSGNPPYYLAEAPVVGASGEIRMGTSSIWSMQSSTDAIFPGQLVLQIRTEDGFQYLAMNGAYAIGDSTDMSFYGPGNVLEKRVFGDYRDPADSVVVNYGPDGQPTSIAMPDGQSCVLENGIWKYDPNPAVTGDEIELAAAPVVGDNGVVSFTFAQPNADGIAGLRIGPNVFHESIAADGAVRTIDPADGSITDEYPSGMVVERSSTNEVISVSFPDGSHYDRVPHTAPPEWNVTIGDQTSTMIGEMQFVPEAGTVSFSDGNNRTTFTFANGQISNVDQVQGGLHIMTALEGGQITLVTIMSADGSTRVLHPVQDGDGVVWHVTNSLDGTDSVLPRNTTVSLDGTGSVIFTNSEAFEGTMSLIAADGNWHVPEPSGFQPVYTDATNSQLSRLALPDQQGVWTRAEGEPETWTFTGPDGETVSRAGHLTFNPSGTVVFEAAGIREEYSYTGPGGAIERVAINANGMTTVATYANGEIVSISLPAGGTMVQSGDFWTVSANGRTVNVLGTPAIVNGQLVMVNNGVNSPAYDVETGEMQFVTLDGTISVNASGIEATTEETIITRMTQDITWLAGVEQLGGADGVLTQADLQLALDSPTLTADQREVVLYLIRNYDQLHPLYDADAGTLTVLSDEGVAVYGPTAGEIHILSEADLLFMVNPNDTASLWTQLAPNGVLTRESLDTMVATGRIGDHPLTAMERAAAFYLQAHWAQFATEGEEMIVAQEIEAANLLAYARLHGINFPDAALPTDQTNDEVPPVEPITGQPVEVTSINTAVGGGGDAQDEAPVLPASYEAVDWLNQHQITMRQYMIVDPVSGQRTGEIDQARVNAQVEELNRRGYENLTADEKRLYDSLRAMQTYFGANQPPYMAENFFRSILLSGDAANNEIGARTLEPGDTVWSMARRFLVEQYCALHNLDPVEQMRLIEQGYGANAELTSYVNANLQTEIDFIFEANHIVGNNIAVGQLLILDPTLAGQNNDAVYLPPTSIDFSGFAQVPSEGQSDHVSHLVNQSTNEEAYILDNGITLTRSSTGTWGAYDANGNLLGLVENNYVDPAAIASGNFTLRLESNGTAPIDSIVVTDEVTTIGFENGSSEQIYDNGVQVYRSMSGEVDQVVVQTPRGPVTYRRLVSSEGVTTGYQVIYEDNSVATTRQAPLPAADGSITFLGRDGQIVTVDAQGNSNYGGVGFQPPVSELDQESDIAA